MKYYIAKIAFAPDIGIEVNHPHGNIQGITTQVVNNKIVRLIHPLFAPATTYPIPTLIEQTDIEATIMAATGIGFVDVSCYNIDAQQVAAFNFQIKIEVYQ